MDSPVTERIFEETLTKDQLSDMLKKKIRPVHWVDGIVSYFRIQKIIDILREEKKSLDPNLDIAIAVLSGGKAKIRNQSHREFCRDIKAKIDDLEGQTDEDLQQPVECLVPGCFPIGPECESLGISGDVLINSKKSFPEAIDPTSITNRVMFELGEYVTRVKESYESLAGWIKKIMGWGEEYDIPAKMVEDWCATLMRDTKKKKKSSLSLAQKYLLERFEFPGLVFPNTTAVRGSEDTTTPSPEQPYDGKKKTDSDNRDSSLIDVEFSGDDGEGDKDEAMDISSFLEEDTPSKKNLLATSSADGEKGMEEHNDNDIADDADKESHKELSSDEEKEATEASTSQSSRKTSSRNAAKAALGRISRTEPKRQSPQSKGASVAPVGKRVTRQAKPSRNTTRRAPAKKTTSKAQQPTRSSSRKRKESSDESSDDDEDESEDEDDDEEEVEDDNDDEEDEVDDENDEENDEDSEEDVDDSSVEEGEVKTPRRGKLVNTRRVKREIAEATKLFTSVSKVVNTLKKEMRIALDYLEIETAKISKNLQKAEKKLDDCMKMVRVEKAQSQSEDEEEEEEEEEEESEEEKSVRRTRGSSSQKTKKITVQVKPGVKGKLKKPLLKVTRISGRNSPSRNPSQTVQSTKAVKTPTKVSGQNVRTAPLPRVSRSTRSKDTPLESVDEIKDFDKEKLFSSRLAVSLTKISEDLVKKALEKNEEHTEDGDIELSGLKEDQSNFSALKKSTKKISRKTLSRQSPESKRDSEGEEEMNDDDGDDQESVEEGEISNVRRGRSGRFVPKKNLPKNTADLCDSKSRPCRLDSDNSDVEKDSTSKKSTRSSSRKNTNGTLKDRGKEGDSSNEEEDKQPTRSPRSRRSKKTKGDTGEATVDSKKEESSSSSWRDRVNSPVETEESSKPSAIDSPYSGSEDDQDLPKKKSEPSAFAALAAGMSSFGDWRGASAKEKVKKRSLNDFVKMLNSPKRRKTDSGKRTSPRKKDVENVPNDKSSEEDDSGLMEEENNDDDFLEKQTEMKLQARNNETQDNNKMDETNGTERELESSREHESPEGEQNHSKDSTMGKDSSEDIQAVNKTGSKHSEEEFEKETEGDDEFPGDSIVGKRIRHRCSMGKHGLYKWYEGTVVHKSSASELLKLDEEQFGHLNNLYTFYTVKYDNHDELHAKALEYDWDRENLKFC